MQQAVSACTVCRDGKRVTCRVDDLDIRMISNTKVAARRWFAIESRGEDTVLDRHAFWSSIHKRIEACSVPWSGNGKHFVGRQLDRKHNSRCAKRKYFGGGVLIEAVHRVI